MSVFTICGGTDYPEEQKAVAEAIGKFIARTGGYQDFSDLEAVIIIAPKDKFTAKTHAELQAAVASILLGPEQEPDAIH